MRRFQRCVVAVPLFMAKLQQLFFWDAKRHSFRHGAVGSVYPVTGFDPLHFSRRSGDDLVSKEDRPLWGVTDLRFVLCDTQVKGVRGELLHAFHDFFRVMPASDDPY